MSCAIPSCQSLDSHITGNPTSFVVISGKLDLFPFRLRGRGWGWVGLCALCFCFLLFSYSMHQMQIMWRTSRPSQVYSSCAKARLVRPQEFSFDCWSQQLSRSIWFASSCCVPERHQKGDFTLPATANTRQKYSIHFVISKTFFSAIDAV